MKKWIALLLAALLVLSLTACSSTPSESKPTDNAADSDTPTDTTAATEAEVEFETGAVEGQTYTSDLLKLSLTLDDNWQFLSREEIDQVMGITSDLVSDEEIAKSLEDGNSYTDMYATNTATGATVNLLLQKVGVSALLLNEKSVLEASEESIVAALESMGLSNIRYEIGTMTFAGKEHACAEITGEINGVTLYEKQVCFIKGTYIASITASTVDENGAEEILNQFAAK